jgi:hypothetical protein
LQIVSPLRKATLESVNSFLLSTATSPKYSDYLTYYKDLREGEVTKFYAQRPRNFNKNS